MKSNETRNGELKKKERILARKLARDLTPEEVEQVSGGWTASGLPPPEDQDCDQIQ